MKTLLKKIYDRKFSIREGKTLRIYTDKIKDEEHYHELFNFLKEKYIDEGYGIKSLIKDFDLPITYSVLRGLLLFMKFDLHTPNVANEFLKNRRSVNARKQSSENTGMYSREIQESLQNRKTNKRGIQGYYWNCSKNKYVWLRNSWEFIYAKWLNTNNINWDIESDSYKLIINDIRYFYRPDFFIFNENDELISIVEIKGYGKDKVFKFEKLKEELLNIDMVLITDVKPYAQQNINKEIQLWKILRKSKLNV